MGKGERQGRRYVCAGGAAARPEMIHLAKMVHGPAHPEKNPGDGPGERKTNVKAQQFFRGNFGTLHVLYI